MDPEDMDVLSVVTFDNAKSSCKVRVIKVNSDKKFSWPADWLKNFYLKCSSVWRIVIQGDTESYSLCLKKVGTLDWARPLPADASSTSSAGNSRVTESP